LENGDEYVFVQGQNTIAASLISGPRQQERNTTAIKPLVNNRKLPSRMRIT
jgi:hypothetical protein